MNRLRSFTLHKVNQALSTVILLAIGGYLSAQKIHDFSLYRWFDGTLTEGGWEGFKIFGLFTFGYASLIQIGTRVLEFFPEALKKTQEPERISECLLGINNEIKQHLQDMLQSPKEACSSFIKSHHFGL